MLKYISSALATGLLVFVACSPDVVSTDVAPAQPGIILTNMDTTVSAKDDF